MPFPVIAVIIIAGVAGAIGATAGGAALVVTVVASNVEEGVNVHFFFRSVLY